MYKNRIILFKTALCVRVHAVCVWGGGGGGSDCGNVSKEYVRQV